MIELNVNGTVYSVDVAADTPLLWVIRDHLKLTGTKFGCGLGQCGACMIHIDGESAFSCLTTVSQVGDRKITTIEGLSENSDHPVQKAWIELEVPQCGYCQSGQIMQALALLNDTPNPTDADIDAGMNGNLCRCGTYDRIRKAIKASALLMGEEA